MTLKKTISPFSGLSRMRKAPRTCLFGPQTGGGGKMEGFSMGGPSPPRKGWRVKGDGFPRLRHQFRLLVTRDISAIKKAREGPWEIPARFVGRDGREGDISMVWYDLRFHWKKYFWTVIQWLWRAGDHWFGSIFVRGHEANGTRIGNGEVDRDCHRTMRWCMIAPFFSISCIDLRTRRNVGAWRSLVAHTVRDGGVEGSNPFAPTIFIVLFSALQPRF